MVQLSTRALAYHGRGTGFDFQTVQKSPAWPWLLESCESDSWETTGNKYVANASQVLWMRPGKLNLRSNQSGCLCIYRKFSYNGAVYGAKTLGGIEGISTFQRLFTEWKPDHFWLGYGQTRLGTHNFYGKNQGACYRGWRLYWKIYGIKVSSGCRLPWFGDILHVKSRNTCMLI